MNYLPKNEEMKELFLNWSKRILTPIGKITVIKSLAIIKNKSFDTFTSKPFRKNHKRYPKFVL